MKQTRSIMVSALAAFAMLAAALCLAACASAGGTGASGGTSRAPWASRLSGVPDFVNAAYLNASEDVVVGIGTYQIGADMSRLSMGKTMAETRARADITRQLQSIMNDMVDDYTAMNELDPEAEVSFQENVTRTLSRADLRGCKTIAMDTEDGMLYVVMEYNKSAAANDYAAAAAAAKLAVPAAVAFDALERMDEAFSKAAVGGPVPVTE